MSKFQSIGALSLPQAGKNVKQGMSCPVVAWRPSEDSRGGVVCVALLGLALFLTTPLSAGPKYRAFQHSKAKVEQAQSGKIMIVADHLDGQVSDSPPVFIDGEFSTISRRSSTSPVMSHTEVPIPGANADLPDAERRYQVKANSLRHGLARMAVLYQKLGEAR